MLWVNLIMDTFAALALATEPATPAVMQDKPRGRSDFIVTGAMARSIFGWGTLFVVVLVSLLVWMQGKSESISQRDLTIFYCVFVLLQFWNLFNARRFGDTRSAFSSLGDNKLFLIIALAILVGQIFIVHFGGSVFRTSPLSLSDWLIVIGSTSPVMLIGETARWLKRSERRT